MHIDEKAISHARIFIIVTTAFSAFSILGDLCGIVSNLVLSIFTVGISLISVLLSIVWIVLKIILIAWGIWVYLKLKEVKPEY